MQYHVISYEGKPVGEAQIERQGMFMIIRCHCRVRLDSPRKITVHSPDTVLDLGLCIKEYNGCGLLARIPEKSFPKGALEFLLEASVPEQFIPIYEDAALSSVAILNHGKFELRNGVAGIILLD